MFTCAELAVTTNFSFLHGASHPEELVKAAHFLGLSGVGIADRNTLAGVVRAYSCLKEIKANEDDYGSCSLKLFIGCRLIETLANTATELRGDASGFR